MPGCGTVGTYHNAVASDVGTVIGALVTFRPKDPSRFHRIPEGGEVQFELVPVNTVESETAMRMRREHGRAHRVSVFPLCTRSRSRVGRFWASWHEAWLKHNSRDYAMLNAGWTLFAGLPGSQDKAQVLRVDWDQLPHRGSKQAGHPHWHFDHDLFTSAEPDKIEVAPGLVEIPTDATFAMARQTSLGFVHLAMGAWNKDIDHPGCWQRTYQDDCRQLRDWCVKTLKYLKEQVGDSNG